MSNIEYPIFKPIRFKRFKEGNWENGFIRENEDTSKLIVDSKLKPVLFVQVKNGWF
ncbi:hypothetical protein [Clostridium baratii]|uniref:Uncharacterized protein n=1 Tax=Clostridium baratii TaxID=1561 RepID=A0A174QTD6_9CLOT|nr:hypothetical protein [Clostridium baratii]CUP75181.1 Uncharacterised protein [Clostridium baratii]